MITRAQIRRQLRASGGIMNVTPRERFGIGSKIKDRIRKLIPNELANIAVKAAPFVAPFNPGIAGLMRGIGRFDQRGSISDALKQGLATTAFGAGSRALGGAENIMGGGLRGGFTNPIGEGRMQSMKDLFQGEKKSTFIEDGETLEGLGETKPNEGTSFVKTGTDFLSDKVPGFGKLDQIVQEKLLVGGITAAGTYLYEKFIEGYPEPEPGEDMEKYLAERKQRVGAQMRTYMDSYFANDPEYMALDDAGKDEFVSRYNVRDGGRIGYQTGGISMGNTLQQNIATNRGQATGIQAMLNEARKRAGLPAVQAAPMPTDGRLPPMDPNQPTTTVPLPSPPRKPSDNPFNMLDPNITNLNQLPSGKPQPISEEKMNALNNSAIGNGIYNMPGSNLLQPLPPGSPRPGGPISGPMALPDLGGGVMPRPGPAIDPNNPLLQLENSINKIPEQSPGLPLSDSQLFMSTKLPFAPGYFNNGRPGGNMPALRPGVNLSSAPLQAAADSGGGLNALQQLQSAANSNTGPVYYIDGNTGEKIYDKPGAKQPVSNFTPEQIKFMQMTQRGRPIPPTSEVSPIDQMPMLPPDPGFGDTIDGINEGELNPMLPPAESPFPGTGAYTPPGSENIMGGFRDFMSENYGDGPGLSTADVRKYRLPDGTIQEGSSTSMSRVNEYLRSIGQPPATDVNSFSGGQLQQVQPGAGTNTGGKFTDLQRPRDLSTDPNFANLSPQEQDASMEKFRKETDAYIKRFGSFADGREIDPMQGRSSYRDILNAIQTDYPDIFKTLKGNETLAELDQKMLDEQQRSGAARGGRMGLMGGSMPMGIMRTNQAGVMERDYRNKGGFVPVGVKEKADDVPAMLSRNEFVMTADAVRGAGGGSIDKGAQKMYNTMKSLEGRVR